MWGVRRQGGAKVGHKLGQPYSDDGFDLGIQRYQKVERRQPADFGCRSLGLSFAFRLGLGLTCGFAGEEAAQGLSPSLLPGWRGLRAVRSPPESEIPKGLGRGALSAKICFRFRRFRRVPACSGASPGGLSGVFRRFPACSGGFRRVPAVSGAAFSVSGNGAFRRPSGVFRRVPPPPSPADWTS